MRKIGLAISLCMLAAAWIYARPCWESPLKLLAANLIAGPFGIAAGLLLRRWYCRWYCRRLREGR